MRHRNPPLGPRSFERTIRSLAVIAALTLTMAGCATASDQVAAESSTPTPGDAAPGSPTADPPSASGGDAVVVITHDGGCMMMGPNCLEWSVASDGAWTATRVGEVEEVAAGQVPAQQVTDVVDAADTVLADDGLAGVGPGVCNACVDGIDLRVQVTTPGGVLTLDSVEQDFGADVAVFDAIAALEAELTATTDVPPVSR